MYVASRLAHQGGATLCAALVERSRERVELVRRGAAGSEHLVELEELVVRESRQLRAPPEVLGQLWVSARFREIRLEPQRLRGNRDILRAKLPGDHPIERDLCHCLAARRADGVPARDSKRVPQLGQRASSSTGPSSRASPRSIATS